MVILRSTLLTILFIGLTASAIAQRSAVISTEPNASVWLNGVHYGRTDATGKLQLKSVPTGVQQIRVRADGFRELTKPLVAGNNTIALVKTADETELAFQEAERLSTQDRARAAEAYR
jgi:hypothetical protein